MMQGQFPLTLKISCTFYMSKLVTEGTFCHEISVMSHSTRDRTEMQARSGARRTMEVLLWESEKANLALHTSFAHITP